MSNGLTPKSIVDKNGKPTTVRVNPGAKVTSISDRVKTVSTAPVVKQTDKSRLASANAKLAAVQSIIDNHSKDYKTTGDEVWDRNPVCAECRHSYPCDTRVELEAALSVTAD